MVNFYRKKVLRTLLNVHIQIVKFQDLKLDSSFYVSCIHGLSRNTYYFIMIGTPIEKKIISINRERREYPFDPWSTVALGSTLEVYVKFFLIVIAMMSPFSHKVRHIPFL